jgi:protease-4
MYPPPGPMYPPPMMMPPPGFFRPQKSFARVIFTTLASIIFGLSLTINIYMLFFSGIGSNFGLSSGHGITQTTVVDGDSHEKIAVIPVTGMILDGTAERFKQMLALAEKDANVKAIVIDVDTPGGAVTPSDEINARINKFRKDNPKRPVVVTMGGMATSGGYYVSCAADYIFAQPTTLTGNIGVILPRYNVSKLAKAYGVEESTITAPPDGFKNAGSPFAPINQKDTQYLQGLIDNAYAKFKGVVTAGRQGKLNGGSSAIDAIADGEVYPADKALALGLVDQIGYETDAYDKAAQLAGLNNKMVVKFNKQQSLLDLLGGIDGKSNLSAKPDGNGGVTINGINVNIDAAFLDELSRPRLMYLWRGQ